MAHIPRGLITPPSYLPYIANTAALVNVVPLIAGLWGIWDPAAALRALEFPTRSSNRDSSRDSDSGSGASTSAAADDAQLIRGLVRMYAVRQAALGAGALAAWATGAWRAMGWANLAAGVAVATLDGVVAREVAGHHVYGHWVGVPLALFFGLTLSGIL